MEYVYTNGVSSHVKVSLWKTLYLALRACQYRLLGVGSYQESLKAVVECLQAWHATLVASQQCAHSELAMYKLSKIWMEDADVLLHLEQVLKDFAFLESRT